MWLGWGTLSPTPPGIYRIGAKSEGVRGVEGAVPRVSEEPPSSLLATGSALRLRPRRAVSSAQVTAILNPATGVGSEFTLFY